MGFQDHFSGHADRYARFRPRYPDELIAFLADAAPATELAWDCATGNGQAARGLAGRFRRVRATDASERQIAEAPAHPRVEYAVAEGADSGLPGESVDLVTVAQALHWLDLDRFYAEVRRVLRLGGVIAAWCYNLATIAPEIDDVLGRFYREVVGPYWPPERARVEAGYRDLPFPFDPFPAPRFAMESAWTLDECLGYVATWSAVKNYIRERGHDPTDELRRSLAACWGDAAARRRVHWPLTLLAGVHRHAQRSSPSAS